MLFSLAKYWSYDVQEEQRLFAELVFGQVVHSDFGQDPTLYSIWFLLCPVEVRNLPLQVGTC